MAGEKKLFIMWLLLPAGLLTRPLVGTVKTCDSGGEDEKRRRSECCMALFSNGARGVHGGWERRSSIVSGTDSCGGSLHPLSMWSLC